MDTTNNHQQKTHKTIPIVCPACKKVLGDKVVRADDVSVDIKKLCDNQVCIERVSWLRSDDKRRIMIAQHIGVGAHFIRETLPSLDKFPVGGMSWDESAYIYGPVGTGKTWALSAIACDALAAGQAVKLINWQWFQLCVRDTYKAAGTETELDVLKRYALPDVLCLDDLGIGKRIEGKESQTAIVLLYMLLDKRYSHGKITHITSNVEPDELASIYDPRIARRIAEMCEIVKLSERI